MQNFNEKFKTDLFERCKKFSLDIIKLTDHLPNTRGAAVIANQLIRSSTSIGANMIEGKAASSRIELKKFNEIALKSANETKYWLELLRDGKFVSREFAEAPLKEVTELSKMIASGVMKLKNKF